MPFNSPTLLPRYSIVLLGHPQVFRTETDGREVELQWPLRRALLTVAFLALQPDFRATKEEIIEAVWPDASEETLRKNFHPTLSAARRTLEGDHENLRTLAFRQGLYSLEMILDGQVDVNRFEHLIDLAASLQKSGADREERALATRIDAWRLYRGPLLAGHEAAWITTRRESLHRRYLSLLRDIGDQCVQLGRYTDALDAYRSILLEEPFEEHVHLAVMQLYARQGRRDLVRRQYVRLQELLKELNVQPLAEIQERYHELMR